MAAQGGQEGTYELDAPAEESGVKVLVVGERGTLEDLERVDDRETTVELATGDVVVQVLLRQSSQYLAGRACFWKQLTSLYHLMASAGMPFSLR